MIMCGGSPSAPTPPPSVPEAPRAPVVQGEDTNARDRRRRAAASGQGQSTILTSSSGVQDGAATATKTLLGE